MIDVCQALISLLCTASRDHAQLGYKLARAEAERDAAKSEAQAARQECTIAKAACKEQQLLDAQIKEIAKKCAQVPSCCHMRAGALKESNGGKEQSGGGP